jgi:two-component system sensor histidine kinase KdpD
MYWCDAHDLINAASEAVGESIAGRVIDIDVPDDLPPVYADFALTEQALANLLLNAVLHTPDSTPVFLAVGLDRGGARTFFTVADRGPGFPPAMRERLFTKFARGDIARAGGLGLGLSIVRGFVVAQGGEVVVGEDPGGGAAITIYLPNPPRQAPPPE